MASVRPKNAKHVLRKVAFCRTSDQQKQHKTKNGPEMANSMNICSGLVGQKATMFKNQLAFKIFLKGSKEPRVIQNRLQAS